MAECTPVLTRVAEALGLPVEAFTQRGHLSDEQLTSLRETTELLEAWARISDRQARRRCLSYVKSASERERSE